MSKEECVPSVASGLDANGQIKNHRFTESERSTDLTTCVLGQ